MVDGPAKHIRPLPLLVPHSRRRAMVRIRKAGDVNTCLLKCVTSDHGMGVLAEGAGFEPAIRFPAYTLSRRAPSATRPPLRSMRRGARGLSGGDARLRRAVRLQPLGHPSAACAWTYADVSEDHRAHWRGADPTERAQGINHPARLAKLQNNSLLDPPSFFPVRGSKGRRFGTGLQAGRFRFAPGIWR